ncbi:MAG: MHS family MFS transporter [Hyphomicrobiales bacterium]|nr:MHS family MFS transporter [Hyphomicrobiales bacterium]
MSGSSETGPTISRRSLAGIVGGNTLEWYDFIAYGSVAPLLAKAFFPTTSQSVGLILTFAIFASGYVARPLGGLLIGYVGDRLGRRRALLISIGLMAFPTVAVAALPTYAAAGIVAPLLLLLLRFLQGCSVGGEYPTAMSYVVESAPPGKRGVYGSLTMFGVGIGLLLASGVTTAANSILGPDEMQAWGWRIPFFAASVLVIGTIYLRMGLPESPAFVNRASRIVTNPVLQSLRYARGSILRVFLFLILNSVAFYTVSVFVVTYLKATVGFSFEDALVISTISSSAMLGFIILAGRLSDRIGRRPTSAIAAVLMLLFSYPIFLVFNQGSFTLALIAQLIFVGILAMVMAPIPAMLAEQFPTSSRLSSVGLAFNLSITLFGGTAPLVNEFLVSQTGWPDAPALYLMAASFVTLIAVWTLPETVHQSLE